MLLKNVAWIGLSVSSLLIAGPNFVESNQLVYDHGNLHFRYNIDPKSSAGFVTIKNWVTENKLEIRTFDSLLGKYSSPNYAGKFGKKLLGDFALAYLSHSEEALDVGRLAPRASLHEDRLFFAFTDGKTGDLVETDPNHLPIYDLSQGDVPVIEWTGDDFAFHLIKEKHNELEFIENSDACIRCHDGRPIWFSYPFWPNFYGSGQGVSSSPNESQNSKSFLEKSSGKGRYRYLTYAKSNKGAKILDSEAGTRLSFHLHQLNFIRIWKQLSKSNFFETRKWAIFAALKDCEPIEPYLVSQKLRKKLDDVKAELKRSAEAYQNYFMDNFSRDGVVLAQVMSRNAAVQDNLTFSKLAYVLQGTDVDISKWTLTFQPKKPKNFVLRMVAGVPNQADRTSGLDLRSTFRNRFVSLYGDLSCPTLLEKTKTPQ